MKQYRLWSTALLTLALPLAALAAPKPPPGFNVYLVQEGEAGTFWRGGAPRDVTLKALAAAAKERGLEVTLVDLRHPPTADDQGGKQGRLSPAAEAALVKQLGLRYVSISALDRKFIPTLQQALKRGDVYMHCMYGVNRTGFATARYARATGKPVPRTGLGPRDWRQGDAFEARLKKSR
jgi:hypothetical protein